MNIAVQHQKIIENSEIISNQQRSLQLQHRSYTEAELQH